MGMHDGFNCNFMDDDEKDRLLGNPRPKTLKDIEDSTYWSGVFSKWISYQGSDVQAAYNDYLADRNGDAREMLKKAGPNGDLRNDFYEEVGLVKAQMRQWERDTGTGAEILGDTLREAGL
jgi:hypothetical protein